MFQQSIIEKCSGHYASFSAMFHPLHSTTNEEQYERHLCNQFVFVVEDTSDKRDSFSSHREINVLQINTLHCIVKRTGIQRRTKVSP